MEPSDPTKHEIYEGAVLDVDRHGGDQAPTGPAPKPQLGGSFELDPAVAKGGSFYLEDYECWSDMSSVSPPCPWLESPEHERVWHVSLGPDRKNHG